MRISDWSSDVCSSDLTLGHPNEAILVGAVGWYAGSAAWLQPFENLCLGVRNGFDAIEKSLMRGRNGSHNGDMRPNQSSERCKLPAMSSAARRLGHACVSTGRPRLWPSHSNKNNDESHIT